MQNPPSIPLRTMVARVSPEDVVIYANGALCSYLGLSKQDVLGAPIEAVAARCRGEIATCFSRPESGRGRNHLVTDESGRVFEVKIYSEGGVLDIVLDEVTSAEFIGRELRDSTSIPFETLSEDELRTTRQPERRYLTVSHTQLRGLSDMSDRLPPMELRLMVNFFVEEAGDAIWDTGSTVGDIAGDSVMGIYGAPRHFTDHPLRAVRAACEQMAKTAQMHADFLRDGKELPPCSCGLWTGDALVGTLGNSIWQHYTALGKPVELARRLSELARPGEILLPEHTLTHLLRVLPEGWNHLRAETEQEPDLSNFQWSGDEVSPVPEHLKKVVYLVGPNVQENPEAVEFFFDYMWAFRVPGRDQTVPILRVVRPALVGDSLDLSIDNVVTTQAVQVLGKYKLIEVIGTGGMGRVWRGVDRFGNAVAIKVLHGTETVTEAQLKRFHREAEIMAKLPHRNICRVYEMSEYEGVQFLAMEFVSGLTLSELLYQKTEIEKSGTSLKDIDLPALIHTLREERIRQDQEPPEPPPSGNSETVPQRAQNTRILPVVQTLNIFLKICDAVQYAHEHGVLHRDLKPGNILLREDGEPLVADFGLAKLNEPDASGSLSVSGHVIGTMENMSPEQAESSKDVDERADVFSLGTILYQMLTGRRHFEATGNIVADAQTLQKHEPLRLRALNSEIDSDLDIVTLKALRINPAERYRSVAAFKADLERYQRGEPILAKPLTAIDLVRKLIQRNRSVAAVIAISILIFICGALVSIAILINLLNDAQEKGNIAKAQTEKALKAEADAKTALALADTAKAEGDAAQKLTNKERELREKAETSAKFNEDQLNTLTQSQRQMEQARAAAEAAAKIAAEEEAVKIAEAEAAARSADAQKTPGPGPAADDMRSAHEAFDRAARVVEWELSPRALDHLERNPDEVRRQINSAMDDVSLALLYNQSLTPAWMLKGRLHLALREFDAAGACFARAAQAAESGGLPRDNDDPEKMRQLATDLPKAFGDKTAKAVEMLRAAQLPHNESAAALLKYLDDKARKSPSVEMHARSPVPDELALNLILHNPGLSKPEVSLEPSGQFNVSLHANAANPIDLSPLKGLEVHSLIVSGAKSIDWPSILELPLDTLDLTGCGVDALPPSPRNLFRLHILKLGGTQVANIDMLRLMVNLETLSLKETRVTDVSALLPPLVTSRRLRELDIEGLNPLGLRNLAYLPLESLTLSPELITDAAGLQALRGHRFLKVIRAPGDPEGQGAMDFWRKYDSGGYRKTTE